MAYLTELPYQYTVYLLEYYSELCFLRTRHRESGGKNTELCIKSLGILISLGVQFLLLCDSIQSCFVRVRIQRTLAQLLRAQHRGGDEHQPDPTGKIGPSQQTSCEVHGC